MNPTEIFSQHVYKKHFPEIVFHVLFTSGRAPRHFLTCGGRVEESARKHVLHIFHTDELLFIIFACFAYFP